MLTPKNPNTTPHGGWRYKSSFSGYTSGPFYDLDSLLNDVRTHRNANGISTPLGWRHELLHEMCLQQGLDCKEDVTVHEDTVATQIGRALWVELDAFAKAYPESPSKVEREGADIWISNWISRIPNFGSCNCKKDFTKWSAVYPPDTSSGSALLRWRIIHQDRVNKKLNRPLFSADSAKHKIFEV